MPHVVTQSCVGDGSCVFACPVNCIQPTPDDPAFETAEMLHIDPVTCVDCGACVAACPVDAIKPHTKLADGEQPFVAINAGYVSRKRSILAPVRPPLTVRAGRGPLRVAVVGSGPAAMYAADEILTIPFAEVSVFERLPIPDGLVRTGVAPDHRRTRRLARQLAQIRRHPRLTMRLGVEVGREIGHSELLRSHDAVVYGVGAVSERRLEIPGVDLPGAATATEFVAWYNGHPDHRQLAFDLDCRRAVVIGNGNVALDVARILTIDPDALTGSEISPAALAALRSSRIEEVVIAARRGPDQSSFTLPELVGLKSTPGVELVTDLAGATGSGRKLDFLRELQPAPGATRRIKLRYLLSPLALVGTRRVEAVEFERTRLSGDGATIESTGQRERIDAGLVLSSIGYRGAPIAGLPFDARTGTVPNDRGRVLDPATGAAVPGTYVVGWIKRGPTGFIGTNRGCAQDTVEALVDDFNLGALAAAA